MSYIFSLQIPKPLLFTSLNITTTENTVTMASSPEFDRIKEAEEFDNTKVGVKGLVDGGVTQVPRLFHHPPDTLFDYKQLPLDMDNDCIPVIDMSVGHDQVVDQIRRAASKFGFFQVINHDIPIPLLDRHLNAARAFHELPSEEKMAYYRRRIVDGSAGFGFYSNHDLYRSKAASWRDTITTQLGPNPINPDELPDICREEVLEWDVQVKKLCDRLVGLLSEGLGLPAERLKGDSYLGKISMVGQYYPYCPEPSQTIGLASHTDLGMLTILLQDQVGGLQVKHGDTWIKLKPVHGALVINLGDLFQILSNDIYKSGEHRVYANPLKKARMSIATFFSPKGGSDEKLYGPLDELVSSESPPLYKYLCFPKLLVEFLSRESESKSMADHFRL